MEALCWIDIETTGLDPAVDKILEVYVEVTDLALNTLYATHMWVTKVSRDWSMIDPFVRRMHEDSGLWDEMESIPYEDFYAVKGISQWDIDFSGHLEFVKKAHGIDVLYPSGSSVHFDMDFLRSIGLPLTMQHLSHRHFDVTTLKLFMQTQTGFKPEFEEVQPEHRAASDIRTDINVAKIICAPMTDTSLKAAHVIKVVSAE